MFNKASTPFMACLSTRTDLAEIFFLRNWEDIDDAVQSRVSAEESYAYAKFYATFEEAKAYLLQEVTEKRDIMARGMANLDFVLQCVDEETVSHKFMSNDRAAKDLQDRLDLFEIRVEAANLELARLEAMTAADCGGDESNV